MDLVLIIVYLLGSVFIYAYIETNTLSLLYTAMPFNHAASHTTTFFQNRHHQFTYINKIRPGFSNLNQKNYLQLQICK